MAAPSFDVQFARMENMLSPMIYNKSTLTSVWHRLIDRKPWLDGRSRVQQVLTVQRNMPANIDVWTDKVLSSGTTNNCVKAPDEVPFGWETRNFNLQEKDLISIPICVDDTRDAFEVNQQAKLMFEGLTTSVKYLWGRRYMNEYSRISEHKLVLAEDPAESVSHFPNTPPVYQLGQGILDDIYQQLLSDGAGEDGGPLAMSKGAPVFVLITDMKSSRRIKEESKIFQAILWNKAEVPKLLEPLKVDGELNGFFHTIEVLPKRFYFVDGTYVEALPFDSMEAIGDGKKAPLSKRYLRAPITESYIFLPNVYKALIPNSINSVGNATFDPQSYMGEFKWGNFRDWNTNWRGTWGKFWAHMEMGSMPEHPEFGWAIRHLRCASDWGLSKCGATVTPSGSELRDLLDSRDISYDA